MGKYNQHNKQLQTQSYQKYIGGGGITKSNRCINKMKVNNSKESGLYSIYTLILYIHASPVLLITAAILRFLVAYSGHNLGKASRFPIICDSSIIKKDTSLR